ncbi:MAG: T9SS type B sorting domain-containing protein, partial [Saprospiraceae bacterium]
LTIGDLELSILPPSCTGGRGGSVKVTGVSGGVGPYRFRLNDNRADERTFFGDLPVGDYRLSVLDAAGCTATREFTIETPQQPSVELGPDRQIVLGDSTTLDFITDAPDYDTLIWESAGPLGVPGALTQTVAPLTDRFYRLTLIDGNGCRASDTVLVRVLNELRTFVPNAFTPNGDGVNDLFFPYAGPEIRQIDRFRVYDRWGTMVHQAENFPPNDPAFGWDGLLNGKPLNSAVFVWTIEFVTAEGREVIQQGDVVLRR